MNLVLDEFIQHPKTRSDRNAVLMYALQGRYTSAQQAIIDHRSDCFAIVQEHEPGTRSFVSEIYSVPRRIIFQFLRLFR